VTTLAPCEAALYAPVKAYLEAQGYEVKAEIGPCDVLARRGEEAPVVVELKTGLTLGLLCQAVERQSLFEQVYLAVPERKALRGRDVTRLLRRLGLGLLVVGPSGVTALLDPGPYAPRRRADRAGRLLAEFTRRQGDPETGGTASRKRLTAYRQDALRLAHALSSGPARPADLARALGVAKAGRMLLSDPYGWFERLGRGLYGLSPAGHQALAAWPVPGPLPGPGPDPAS
jgi:hypothetical protein